MKCGATVASVIHGLVPELCPVVEFRSFVDMGQLHTENVGFNPGLPNSPRVECGCVEHNNDAAKFPAVEQ